jgi:hypothetical protein
VTALLLLASAMVRVSRCSRFSVTVQVSVPAPVSELAVQEKLVSGV